MTISELLQQNISARQRVELALEKAASTSEYHALLSLTSRCC